MLICFSNYIHAELREELLLVRTYDLKFWYSPNNCKEKK